VPLHVSGVDDSLLDPRSTWRDPELYDLKARELAAMFAANFAKRFPDVEESIRAAGPSA
jgi:phosphoenolpyruvate carboxykinase (ATP)